MDYLLFQPSLSEEELEDVLTHRQIGAFRDGPGLPYGKEPYVWQGRHATTIRQWGGLDV